MNINITREDFERYCPSAVMPDDVVYNRISAYFDDGMRLAQRIVGPDVPDDVETLRLATRVSVLEAYNLAIPHLDLVLTENGFGVVSNQNVAPASRDRVLRLAQQVRDSRDDAVDDLLDRLRGKEQWWEHAIAIGAFASLVWNAKRQLPVMGVTDAHRTKMTELRPRIDAAEELLKQYMSEDLHLEMRMALLAGNLSADQTALLHKALLFIGAYLDGNQKMIRWHMAQIIEFLERHLDTFETYKTSSAHQANTFTPYSNKKDDPCYFFG